MCLTFFPQRSAKFCTCKGTVPWNYVSWELTGWGTGLLKETWGCGSQPAKQKPEACSGAPAGLHSQREVTIPHLKGSIQNPSCSFEPPANDTEKPERVQCRAVKMAGSRSHILWKAERTGFVHAGETEASVGVNRSFPFIEWKFLRRLSRNKVILQWSMVWG